MIRNNKLIKKILVPVVAVMTAALTLTGCAGSTVSETIDAVVTDTLEATDASQVLETVENTAILAEEDAGYEAYDSDATMITLNGSSAEIDGSGAELSSDGTLYITEDGSYVLSGTYNRTVVVECTGEKDDVTLYLNGVTISSPDYAAIVCYSADNLVISVVPGTVNTLEDGSSYALVSEDDNTDATIFSKCDLTINGTGTLKVSGNYNNAIVSKDDLVITQTDLIVDSVDDAIVGKDSVQILGGTIDISATGKGIESTYEDDEEKGYILVTGGTITVNTQDDCLHATNIIEVDGGELTLTTADDGIHTDTDLLINAGTITVTESYEGLEGNTITINGGTIDLTASDDGINVAGGNDSSGTAGGFGQDMFATDDSCVLTINGGIIQVAANGDGLDSNGSIEMTGGYVTVWGPTDGANGSLDYGISFNLDGGTLLLAGNSGMAQYPSNDSGQNSMVLYLDSYYDAGTSVVVKDSSGNEVLSFVPGMRFNFLVISDEALMQGETYTVIIGSEETTLTLDAVNTISGTATGMEGMQGGFGGGMGGQMPGGGMPSDGEMPSGEAPTGEMPSGGMQGGFGGGRGPRG